MTEKKQRRKFDKAFKKEALLLALRVGVKQAAQDLGLQSTQIYAWRSQARNVQAGQEVRDNEAKELERLRKVVKRQKEELEILKKAAAFFARHTE